jgi:hypothetical protein
MEKGRETLDIKKYNRVGRALLAEATTQARHAAYAGRAQAQLNGPCPEPACHTRPIWRSMWALPQGARLLCSWLLYALGRF